MNVNIKYKDGQNWTNAQSQIIDWSSYAQVYKDQRVQPAYLAPEISTNTWNGVKHDVQHIRWDAWKLEFYGRESELQDLSRMQSCESILIEDIDNGLNHTVDMQVSEWLSFGEPEYQANTSNYRLILEYRTNKTIINKFEPLDNEVTLSGSGTYYSKYEKLSYNGELEEIAVQWGEGEDKILQETNNIGYNVLLYLSDSEKETFKNDWNQELFTIDTVDIIRKLPLEITGLGENNNQILVKCIIERDTIDNTVALSNVVTITGDFPSTYYSKFEKLEYLSELNQLKTPWTTGGEVLLHETKKTGYRVLLYLTSSDFATFNNDYNVGNVIVDSIDVIEKFPLEITELESGYYQVIMPYVITRTDTDKVNALANVVTLVGGSGTYYSKFAKLYIPTIAEQITTPWPDGSNRLLRETNKDGYKVFLYLNNANMQTFKEDFNQNTFTIDAGTIIEKLPLEITENDRGYYQIIASMITDVDENTYDLTPLNTHTLVVTDSGSYTFYTDYSTEPDVDDTTKDAFSNEDGLPVDAKTIDKQVTNIKLFLNTSDKNSLKLHYERGNATIDAVPILYRGIVATNKLGNDLWEVDISDITITPVPTYPL